MSSFVHLANPWWLAAMALLPILAWARHRRERVGAMTYSRLPLPVAGAWRIHLPFYLRLAALGLLFVALSRPQAGFAWEESLTQGIDIEIVLDVSGSMGAEDFQPRNRLEVAKTVVKEFIAQRPADRIGLVVFSGAALSRAPLTSDREMLAFLIDSLALNTMPDGTAIGVALANAASRLKDGEARSRVIVLVTDGVNNVGAIDPMSAAAICQGLGIRVYTIGVGTGGRVPVPMQSTNRLTGRTETRRVMLDVAVDEELLERIAERTDGRFYKATNPEALRRVFAEIDELERTPLRVKQYVRYEEAYLPWAAGSLALLVLPLAIGVLRQTVEP